VSAGSYSPEAATQGANRHAFPPSPALPRRRVQSLTLANIVLIYLVVERLPAFLREWRTRMAPAVAWWRADWSDAIAWGFVAVIAIPLFRLYSTHMIPWEDGRIYSGGSCWADLPIHMHIAESFLSGRNNDVSWGDMHSPVFAGAWRAVVTHPRTCSGVAWQKIATTTPPPPPVRGAGEKMYYPFIPDWHAAVMVKQGASMRWGFLAPGERRRRRRRGGSWCAERKRAAVSAPSTHALIPHPSPGPPQGT